MIEKTVEITEKDIFLLNVAPFRQYNLKLFGISFFLFVCSGFFMSAVRGEYPSSLLVVCVVAVLFVVCMLLIFRYTSRKVKKETAVFRHPLTCTFNENEFHIHGYKMESALDWKDFYNYMEDNNAIYLFISSMQSYIVPKRYFPEGELLQVREMISSGVKKRSAKGRIVMLNIISAIFLLHVLINVLSFFLRYFEG